jgi:CxxC motif-containing protein (DUF1111 family)
LFYDVICELTFLDVKGRFDAATRTVTRVFSGDDVGMKNLGLAGVLFVIFQCGVTQSGVSANFGDPLPGMTTEQAADFALGSAGFQTTVTPAPIFNDVSCVACHSSPAPGGGNGLITVTRFGRMVNGVFDPMVEKGGSLLQKFGVSPDCTEVIPAEATVTALRRTTPCFGFGLIEAIPDAAIEANILVNDPDGIRGRAHFVVDVPTGMTRVGRFGWKAQQATLLAFSGDAYVNEMGITTRFFPKDEAPNGDTNKLALCDTNLDPENHPDEAGKDGPDRFSDFMRFLAPPPTNQFTARALAGQTIFMTIGCAKCHVPLMMTGPNTNEAVSLKPVPLYSDLLLHDMGLLGDGIGQGNAGTREMRTMFLWGARVNGPYLHDGRASTLEDAIRAHDGEAAKVKAKFNRLRREDRARLIEFLNSI